MHCTPRCKSFQYTGEDDCYCTQFKRQVNKNNSCLLIDDTAGNTNTKCITCKHAGITKANWCDIMRCDITISNIPKTCGYFELSPAIASTDTPIDLKYDNQKQRWELLPMDVIAEAVKRYTHGASKYKADSWKTLEDGENRYYAALLRHLAAWRTGEKMDPDVPELTHLSAVLWNAIALVWFELHGSK